VNVAEMCPSAEKRQARRFAPGGSADLLAATIFLDAVDRQQTEVSADQSGWFDEKEYKPELEEIYGAA
jgi:hypothetical protein